MATTTPTPIRPTDDLSAKAARLEADLLNAPPPAAAEPVTETDKLAMTGVDIYYGSHRAVRDVNLRVQVNAITAFIGPSGCGKSTVLRCFNRMNDLPVDLGARDEVVHAVEAAEDGALAAARRTDEGGDGVHLDPQVDVAHGLVAAVVDVDAGHRQLVGLGDGLGRSGWRGLSRSAPAWPPWPRGRPWGG